MTTEQLQKAVKSQPFLPFLIHLADGATVPVPHPEFIAHKPGGRTAIVITEDETWHVIDLLLVTRLEFEPAKAAPKRKGK